MEDVSKISYEEKQKKLEEELFRKRWAKHLKLSPILTKVSKNVGKAPRCNSKNAKKEIAIAVVNKKNKK